jgi:hypothetical protein
MKAHRELGDRRMEPERLRQARQQNKWGSETKMWDLEDGIIFMPGLFAVTMRVGLVGLISLVVEQIL